MPSKKSSPNAPGTYVQGGVRCTVDAPFKAGMNTGSQRDLGGTFDKPRSGGDNGLPTTVSANLGGSGKAPKPSSVNSTPPNRTAKRPGTKSSSGY